jgi:dihydroneopterin aldolase/2-amino-4-hydroxy-6-hydroxymethyldihydropteridine diphosphokinase/dihydropteroate synthase
MDLTIRKPSALPFATPSISISRDTSYSPIATPPPTTQDTGAGPSRKRVFIALGSNIGDRVGNVRRAVNSLEGEGVEVVRTGRMYESEPMYVEDQARFINTVIEVSLGLCERNLSRDGEVGRRRLMIDLNRTRAVAATQIAKTNRKIHRTD